MISHRFLPSAREELNEAAAFYEAAVAGLGEAFLDDVERAIETICDAPRIGASVGRGFRRILLRRFPITVFYVPHNGEIVIVAITHQRRRPGYWRGRQ